MNTKLKIGDIVKIKKCKVGVEYGGWIFERLNKRYIGKTAKIVRVNKSTYDLDIDDGILYWTDEMLEPVKENKESEYDRVDRERLKEQDIIDKENIKYNSNEVNKPKSIDELEVVKKIQIIRNYAHDYRDIKMNEFELEKMLINFVSEFYE